MKTILVNKNKGFSLVELLVALCLSGIIVSSVYGLFISQNTAYINQNLTAEMQQNARMAMNLLAGEFRMAGFGFSMSGNYSSSAGTFYAVTPNNSTSGPDSVTIRYCVDPNSAGTVTLKNPVATSNPGGSISLVVNDIIKPDGSSVSGTTGFSVNDYIILSDGQNASRLQITAVNSGTSTLNCSSVTPNIFPAGGFIAGSRVYKLREITYRISNNVLQMQPDGVTWQDIVNNVEDMQLAYQGSATPSGTWLDNPSPVDQTTLNDVQINLLAISSSIDLNYTGQRPLLRDHSAGPSDHSRRRLLTSTIRIRNL
jgi:prepilin-type N-terminal cleavage/methylation domain-containing protein